MAEIEGKLLTCDVCGESVFLKYVETKDYDGGFTHLRTFEKKPEGWTYINPFKHEVQLCPSCAERIKAAIESAVSKIQGETKQDG